MKHRFALSLAVLLTLSASSLQAGEVRIETKYFMGDIPKESTLPAVSPSWTLHSKKKFTTVTGGKSTELLSGPDQGTTIWEIGNRVVSVPKSGELIVTEKLQEETGPDTSWASKLQPKKVKQNGVDILTYETNGGFRRLWVSEKTGNPIAMTEGRFITFFEISDDNAQVKPPENVVAAIAQEKEQQKKLGERGAMPQ